MRRAQVWTSRNMWGEIERWYRLPVKITTATMVDLAGIVDEVAGPWTSILRTEVWTSGGRVWLTAHRDGELLCASAEGIPDHAWLEIDARVASSFGSLEELVTDELAA